jgi:hypothetical protein
MASGHSIKFCCGDLADLYHSDGFVKKHQKMMIVIHSHNDTWDLRECREVEMRWCPFCGCSIRVKKDD